jgi:hypothetical protein
MSGPNAYDPARDMVAHTLPAHFECSACARPESLKHGAR